MPITPKGFDDDIEALIDEVETETRKIAFAWLQALMLGTPVDTGFHRNNWHLDFDAVNARVEGSPLPSTRAAALDDLPPLDGTSNGRLRAAASFLESWKSAGARSSFTTPGPRSRSSIRAKDRRKRVRASSIPRPPRSELSSGSRPDGYACCKARQWPIERRCAGVPGAS